MRNTSMAVALALMLGGLCMTANVFAQTPPQEPVTVSSKLNLTLEQRHVIREIIKDMKIEPAADMKPAVGDQVPGNVRVQEMPNQVTQKVPQVKTHEFFVADGQIVIVDPKDHRVAEVIKLTAD